MIAKLVLASLLATPWVSGTAQETMHGADGSTAQWPHMHQCALHAVSNFTVQNTGGVTTGALRQAGEIMMTRIDLEVAGAPGGSPTITALAIKTKGTGAQRQTYNGHATTLKAIARANGEMRNQTPIGVDCVTSVVTGDEAAQKATLASFAFMSADGKGLGWSCSVSGSEDKPQFTVGLLVPAILGQADRGAGPRTDAKSEWSWGTSNRSSRVSIVPRDAGNNDRWHIACAPTGSRKYGYDLAVLK